MPKVYEEGLNVRYETIKWPLWMPRVMRHPFYDNIIFSYLVLKTKPDLIISPYHDVRMPKNAKCIISILDLCLEEMDKDYPWHIRMYYLMMLN
jgi:hypothetical protein